MPITPLYRSFAEGLCFRERVSPSHDTRPPNLGWVGVNSLPLVLSTRLFPRTYSALSFPGLLLLFSLSSCSMP